MSLILHEFSKTTGAVARVSSLQGRPSGSGMPVIVLIDRSAQADPHLIKPFSQQELLGSLGLDIAIFLLVLEAGLPIDPSRSW